MCFHYFVKNMLGMIILMEHVLIVVIIQAVTILLEYVSIHLNVSIKDTLMFQ